MPNVMRYSGYEWIGEIPENWNVIKIGSIYTERRTKVNDIDYPPLSVTKQGILPQLENVAKSDDSENRKLVKTNDFVINSRSDRRGSCGISNLDGSVSLINTVLIPKLNMNNIFYNFVFKSEQFSDEFYKWGHGIVADLWTTKWTDMKNIYVPSPRLDKQKRIADYLDEKCAKIDKAIEDQKQIIEKLKEYKQSVITEAVTKGLDPNVPMKDSGVEWIGKIPAHWIYRPLKTLGKVKGRIGFKGYTVDDLVDSSEAGCALVLGGTNVMKDGFISYHKNTYISEFKYLESPEIMLRGGEILITKVGAGTGESAVYYYKQDRVTINPNVMLFVTLNISDAEYINYFLQSKINKTNVEIESTKSGAQPAINQEFVRNIRLPWPPKEERDEILKFITKIISKVKCAIQQKEETIEKLTAYKKSLIYECVTGKKEII